MKPKAVIVDLDGTICENVTRRPWYGKGAAEGMLTDAPYTDVINMIKAYCQEFDLDILILTGRNDTPEIRQATLEWLGRNKFYHHKLYMRRPKDFSKSAIFKERVYEEQIKPKYDIVMIFEDNNSCVEMFREKGLLVLQPQNSDY